MVYKVADPADGFQNALFAGIAPAGALRACAASVRACATHAVFSGHAYDNINRSSLKEVFVTDTIPLTTDPSKDTSKIRVVSMASTFARIIKKVYNYEPISSEFIF